MLKFVPTWRRAWSYAFAIALGWGGAMMAHRKGAGTEGPGGRSAGRAEEVMRGPQEVLARLEAAEKVRHWGGPTREEREAELDKAVVELRRSMKLADDPAAAMRKAVAGFPVSEVPDPHAPGWDAPPDEAEKLRRAEVAVRVIQWLEADPDAALRELAGMGDLDGCGAAAALRVWTRGLPVEEAMRRVESAKSGAVDVMAGALAMRVAELGDGENLGRLLGGPFMPHDRGADHWRSLTEEATAAWPYGKLEDLVMLGVRLGRIDVSSPALHRLTPADLCTMLPHLLENRETWSRLICDSPSAAWGLVERVQQNREMPFPEKLALCEKVLAAGTPLEGEPEGAREMATSILTMAEGRGFYNEGAAKALAYEFRLGLKDVHEAERAMLAEMPGLMVENPEEAKNLARGWLTAADPARAVGLLDGVPQEEKVERFFGMLKHGPFKQTPEQWLALVEALPAGSSKEDMERWEIVLGRWDGFHESGWCHDWAVSLPPGQPRDMALEALAGGLEEKQPEQAAALRAMMTNPEVGRK